MGADGYRVNNQADLKNALEEARLKEFNKSRRPAVVEVMTDGLRLAPPFFRDALARLMIGARFLPKYENNTYIAMQNTSNKSLDLCRE